MHAHEASNGTTDLLDETIDWGEILQLGAADAELLELSALGTSKPQADGAWLLEGLLRDDHAVAADVPPGITPAARSVSEAAQPQWNIGAPHTRTQLPPQNQALEDESQHSELEPGHGDVAVGVASSRGLKPTRREKNILAQRLWRVKQKERAQQAAEQVAALEQEMLAMQLAQGELARRNQALEQALGGPGHRAAAAAEAAAAAIEPFAASIPDDYASSGAESAAGAALAKGATQGRRGLSGGNASGGSAGGNAAAAWPLPTGGRSQQGLQDAGSWKDSLAAELGIGGEMLFTVRWAGILTMSWRQVAAMEAAAFDRLWHDYISAMAACLLQLRAAGDTRAATGSTSQRLAQLATEAQHLQASVLLHDLHGLPRQPPGTAAAAAAEEVAQWSLDTWWQLLETAHLGREQRRALLRHREAYLHNKARLIQTRNRFKVALPAAYSNEAALGLNERGTLSVAHERLQAALGGLQDTLNAEHAAAVQATAAMLAVLTPAQYAHLTVGCPARVDMLHLAETLAVATGQPASHAILAQQLQGDDSAVEAKPTWPEVIRALEAAKAAEPH